MARAVAALASRIPAVYGLGLGALAAALATLLRYRVIEPAAMGAACDGPDAPVWCGVRTALIVATEWNGVGLAAVACAIGALLCRGARGRVLGWAAMLLGGAGLLLYNASAASLAVPLALLTLARRDDKPAEAPQLVPERGQPRQR